MKVLLNDPTSLNRKLHKVVKQRTSCKVYRLFHVGMDRFHFFEKRPFCFENDQEKTKNRNGRF